MTRAGIGRFGFARWLLATLLILLAWAGRAWATGPVLLVEDRAVLTDLEEVGYGFGALFGQPAARDLASLQKESAAYRSIIATLGTDVALLRADMTAAGRSLYEVTDGNVGRVIDMRWLASAAASFRLVGVVNRIDRRDFLALTGSTGCGEVRLVYRLSYAFRKDGRGRVLASRLPVSINAVFDVSPDADGRCEGAAARWTRGGGGPVDARWLADAPLHRAALTFRQIEINAQVVRFPSGQETEFGGQAAYLMRIFALDGDAARPVGLENTIDAARIKADAALKASLIDFVRANLASIDTGVYRLPDAYLVHKVVSYSTFGSVRQGNRPLTDVISSGDLAGLDYGGRRLVRSAQAVIDRLDNGACQGCHQNGSTAGFHLIGLDDATVSPLNRIAVGISPHLHAELARREAWMNAVSEGREPDRFRPLSAAPPAAWTAPGDVVYRPAEAGMPCMMPREQAQFASGWGCAQGTVCTPLATASGGRFRAAQCLLPEGSPEIFSGHPCLQGDIVTDPEKPFNDRMSIRRQFAAFNPTISRAGYTCRPPKIGVPAGIAYRACDDRDRSFAAFQSGKPMPREICGLAGGKKFDLCVATNAFDQCLGGAVVRGNRPACSSDRPCREDFMCQAFPPDTPGLARIKGIGFCSPTYFVFQMRIDNHTTPWGGGSSSAIRRGRL